MSETTKRRVLVLSPHADDGELGAGAYIGKLATRCHEVHTIVVCDVVDKRHNQKLHEEHEAAMAVLGVPSTCQFWQLPDMHLPEHRQLILQRLYDIKESFDLILVPALWDCHQDHQVVTQEALRAFKYHSILGYELPWNNVTGGQPNVFVELSPEELARKERALQCFATQIELARPYFEPDVMLALARVRGKQAGLGLAEGYQCIRWIT